MPPRTDLHNAGRDNFTRTHSHFSLLASHGVAFGPLWLPSGAASWVKIGVHVRCRMTLPSPSILGSTGALLQHWGGTTDVRVPRDLGRPARRAREERSGN